MHLSLSNRHEPINSIMDYINDKCTLALFLYTCGNSVVITSMTCMILSRAIKHLCLLRSAVPTADCVCGLLRSIQKYSLWLRELTSKARHSPDAESRNLRTGLFFYEVNYSYELPLSIPLSILFPFLLSSRAHKSEVMIWKRRVDTLFTLSLLPPFPFYPTHFTFAKENQGWRWRFWFPLQWGFHYSNCSALCHSEPLNVTTSFSLKKMFRLPLERGRISIASDTK